MTLRKRAAKETTPSRCWVCRLPAELRLEIDDILRTRDFTKALLVRTLRADGYTEATRNKLNYHGESGHHQTAVNAG